MQHSIPVQFSRYNFHLDSLRFELLGQRGKVGEFAEPADSLICCDLSSSCSGNERICVNRLNKVDWSVAEFGIGIGIAIGTGINIGIAIGIEGKLDRIGAWGVCVMNV